MTLPIDGRRIRDYLLGASSENECSEIEALFFGSPEQLAEVEAHEAELVDDYVRGRLSGPDRGRFEERYLGWPARHRRVRFARALAAVVDAEGGAVRGSRSPRRGFLRVLPIAASIVLALTTTALLSERTRLRHQFDGLRHEAEALRSGSRRVAEELAAERRRSGTLAEALEQAREAVTPSRAGAAFVAQLAPLLRSESAPQPLSWPAGTEAVELRLGGDLGRYPVFRVSVERRDGTRVWSGTGRRIGTPGAEAIGVRMAATLLPPGDYLATLQGELADAVREDLHRYSFRVSR